MLKIKQFTLLATYQNIFIHCHNNIKQVRKKLNLSTEDECLAAIKNAATIQDAFAIHETYPVAIQITGRYLVMGVNSSNSKSQNIYSVRVYSLYGHQAENHPVFSAHELSQDPHAAATQD